jgi:hypothetical protein
MGKYRFEVGEREKHSLTVDWDTFMKTIHIELDDQKIADEFHYSPGAKKFTFDVGSSEVHKVEVTVGMMRWVFGRNISVLVDGMPAQSSSAAK